MKGKIFAILSLVMAMAVSGCSAKTYGEEYNSETDYQYSYTCSTPARRDIQSDDGGQYIYVGDYIYYYNSADDTLAPLCNKANCLHDSETEVTKKSDCNAYVSRDTYGYSDDVNNYNEQIQYSGGYIYFARANMLYRMSADGSSRDVIFKSKDSLPINYWIVHRGVFYYETEQYYYEEDDKNQIYSKSIVKSVPIKSNMKDKDAKIVYESDDEHTIIGFGGLEAYRDYLVFSIVANRNGFKMESEDSWLKQVYSPTYLYNIGTEELNEIGVPEGYSDTTGISAVRFMEDGMLISLYDNMQDGTFKLPIYSLSYDLEEMNIWMDDVIQSYELQTYDNKVILNDLDYQVDIEENQEYCNYYVYNSDAEPVSEWKCPTYGAVFLQGVGPDGVQVLFEGGEGQTNIYETDIDEIINSEDGEVQPKQIGTIGGVVTD